jgi:hypothetical protein
MPWWSRNPCWDDSYDGESEPENEQQSLTRNGETVADALTGKPEDEWNRGTYGDHDCDFTEAQHDFANVLPETRDDYGVGFSSAEEVQRYYDQLRPEDIRILQEDDDD